MVNLHLVLILGAWMVVDRGDKSVLQNSCGIFLSQLIEVFKGP